MRGLNIIITILMFIGISLETSQAIEEKRVKIIEIAESGQIFEFQMSPEEIASEDAEKARLVALRKTGFNKPKKPVASFELAESGMIIEFIVNLPEFFADNRQR